MSGEIHSFPYREGEPPPGPGYIQVQMVDDSGQNLGLCWMRPQDLENAPIRHEAVEPLLPMLRWVWRHLSRHIIWCRTFDDWELGFMRGAHPGSESSIWACHTYAYLDFLHRHPNADKAGVFRAIMSLMNGRDHEIEPASVAQTLKRLVANPPSVLNSLASFTKDGRLKTTDKHLR